MTLYLFILSVFSCIALTKLLSNAAPAEDLIVEYYTTTDVDPGPFTKQDEIDAKDIWQSDRKEDVIAGIIMYRDKSRRLAITRKILSKIHGDFDDDSSSGLYDEYWISEIHYVQSTKNSTYPFKDLVFGLTYHENNVLNEYLFNFFLDKDESWIIIGMILAKDMDNMIATYDKNHRDDFASQRNYQKKPFKFMLRAWVRHPREPIEKEPLDQKLISQLANDLKTEYESDGWRENRDTLELVVMRKSIKYARLVIQEFEKIMALNKPMEDIINESVKDHDLNHDLADAYSSLTRYIKDKFTYIAKLLDQYSDGKDQWAAWIMCIAVVRPEEWPKIDEIFKKDHNGDSLSKFITQKLTQNKVMAEMMAMTVDSNFKPTSFTERPVPENPGQPSPAPAPATP